MLTPNWSVENRGKIRSEFPKLVATSTALGMLVLISFHDATTSTVILIECMLSLKTKNALQKLQ
jgi:hypothetical protein